jgi:hypothetical protein
MIFGSEILISALMKGVFLMRNRIDEIIDTARNILIQYINLPFAYF